MAKWYSSYTLKEKAKLTRDVTNVVFERANKACNFVEYKGMKIIYRRYDDKAESRVLSPDTRPIV